MPASENLEDFEQEGQSLEDVAQNNALFEGKANSAESKAEDTSPTETTLDTSWYDANSTQATFTISTPQQLAGLAALVNAGNDFEGKTVTLSADIDLTAFENWIPIGRDENSPFSGTFDGAKHRISNLCINDTTLPYAGLFGLVKTSSKQAVLKNVIVANAQVVGRAHVGALAGSTYTGIVEGCHVTGLIQVQGNYKVGGLAGEGYAKMTNCSVMGEEGSYVKGFYDAIDFEGDNVGGLIGMPGEGGSADRFMNCSVSGLTVSGTRKVGGLLGYLHYDNLAQNCSVSNTTVACDLTGNPDYLSENTSSSGIGGLAGVANGKGEGSNAGTLRDCTISNVVLDVRGTTSMAGYLYGKLRDTTVLPIVENCYAIGSAGSTVASDTTAYKGNDGAIACVSVKRGEEELPFLSLKEAFDTAQNGDTLTLVSDIVIDTSGIATLKAGVEATLDMAGKKITVAADFNGRPLVNYGTLTVRGNGAIDSSASELGGYGAINNYSELTIVDGLYRGSLKASGASIFNRSKAVLVVEGGTFDGATCALYNEGKATIDGGTFNSISCNYIKVNGESIHSYTIRSFGELQFNEGEVTGVQGGLAVAAGYAEINGGVFTSRLDEHGDCTFYALYVAGEKESAECDINGGTFKSELRHALWVGNDNTNGDGGLNEPATANIYGGSFSNPAYPNDAFLTGPSTGTPRVYGGIFDGRVVARQGSTSTDLGAYVAPSRKIIERGGKTEVVERSAENSTAKLGDVYFDDLKEAFAAAGQMESKAVVELLSDTTVSSSLTVPDGKDITLKGNGKTIMGDKLWGSNLEANALFLVSGNLTVENANVKNVGIGVRTKGAGSVVTVTDSDIEAQYYALAVRNVNQKLVVSNSTLTGWSGIMTTAGTLGLGNNTNATISVTGSTINCKPVTNEPYGAIVLQENFHGVTVLVENTEINLFSNSQSTPKPLAFDIRAYGSTISAQNVKVNYDESVTTADAVFALKQYSSDAGEVRPSTIAFTGESTAPENLHTVIYGSESGPEKNIRRIEGDSVSINGFSYAPDADGAGHRLFTANDVSVGELTYAGVALTPSLTVMAGDEAHLITLESGTDFGVTYQRGDSLIAASDIKDAGDYTAVIKGKGDYREVEVSKDFTIGKAELSAATVANIEDAVYDGAAHAAAPKLTFVGVDIPADEVTLSYADANDASIAPDKIIGAGAYKVIATAKETSNFAGSIEAEFHIVARALVAADFTVVAKTYRASAYRASDLVKLANTDSGITFEAAAKEGSDLLSAGEQIIVVTGTENYKGDVTVESSINKKEASVVVAAALKVRGNADPQFTGTRAGFIEGDDPRVTYKRAEGSEGKENVGADIDITATCENTNYKVAATPAKLTIEKAVAWVSAEGKTTYYASFSEALKAADTGAVLTIAHGAYDLAWEGSTCLVINKNITLQGETGSNITLRPAAASPQNGSVVSVAKGVKLTLKNVAIDRQPASGVAKAARAVSIEAGATLNATLCSFDTSGAVSLAAGATAMLARNFWGEAGPDAALYGDTVYPYYKESARTTLVNKTEEEQKESDIVGKEIDDIGNKAPEHITKEEAAAVVESLVNASQSTRDELTDKFEQLAKIEEAYMQTAGVTKSEPDYANVEEIVAAPTVSGAALSVPPSTNPEVNNAAKVSMAPVRIPEASLPAGVKEADIIPLDITLGIVAVSKDGAETVLSQNIQPVAPLTITMTVGNKWGTSYNKIAIAHYHNDEVSFIRPSAVTPSVDNAKLTLTFTLTKLSSVALVAMDEHKIAIDETALAFGEVVEGDAAPEAKTITITNQGTNSVTLEQPQSADAFEVGMLSATELAANGATATFTIQPKSGLVGGAQQALKEYKADITVSTVQDATAKVSITATFSVEGKPEASEQLKVQAYSASFDGYEHEAVEVVGGKLEGDVYSYSIGGGAAFTTEVPRIRDAGTYPLVIKATNPNFADRVITLDAEKAPSVTPADAAQLTIDPISAQTYTGGALTPKPVVRLGSETLIEGRDYALSYANNVEPGEATVTVTGIDDGNIAGSQELSFAIEKAISSGNIGTDKPVEIDNGNGSQESQGSPSKDTPAAFKLLRTGDDLTVALATGGGMALLAAFIAAATAMRFRRKRK